MPLTRKSGSELIRKAVGVGIALETDGDSGLLRITKVFPKSPAGQADVAAGLLIRQINGVSVKDKSLSQCMQIMSGPEGTRVRLLLVDTERMTTKTVELRKTRFLFAL